MAEDAEESLTNEAPSAHTPEVVDFTSVRKFVEVAATELDEGPKVLQAAINMTAKESNLANMLPPRSPPRCWGTCKNCAERCDLPAEHEGECQCGCVLEALGQEARRELAARPADMTTLAARLEEVRQNIVGQVKRHEPGT